MAVREGDVGPQLQRVAQAVVGARPAFGEPRLDFLRDAVDAHQPGLREGRDQVGAGVAAFASRLNDGGSVRMDTSDSPPRGPAASRCRPAAGPGSGAGSAGTPTHRAAMAARDGGEDPEVARLSGQKLAHRPRNCPIKIVCSPAVPCVILHAKSGHRTPDPAKAGQILAGRPAGRVPSTPIVFNSTAATQRLTHVLPPEPSPGTSPCAKRTEATR